MKKFLFLFVCMLWQLGASAQFSGSGSGTQDDPYLIFNPTQLAQMANFLNKPNVVFELKNDLDLAEFIEDNYPNEGWLPVGVEESRFDGVFRGNNHTISNLWINRPSSDYVGLFGCIRNATITDLTIETTGIRGRHHVGTAFGLLGGCCISNVHVVAASNTIVEGTYEGSTWVGGFCGFAVDNSSITNCSLTGTPKVIGDQKMGGFSGELKHNSYMQNCIVEADVHGTDYVGGISGISYSDDSSHNVRLINCRFTGAVEGAKYVGGLIGFPCNGKAGFTTTITQCSAICNISGTSNAGGIVGGVEDGTNVVFSEIHHRGDIINTGDYTGGILGYGDFTNMTNCSHFGDITGKNYVGGIIGASKETSVNARSMYYTSGSRNSFYDTVGPFYPTTKYTNTQKLISNCSAIGDIRAASNVGGIIGSCADDYGVTSRSYTGGNSISPKFSGGAWWVSTDGGKTFKYTGYTQTGSTFSPIDYVTCNYTSLINSYYSGNIIGLENVGGISGYQNNGEIRNCYSYATISGNKNIGGIVGQASGSTFDSQLSIKANVAINTIISANVENVGRIYGSMGDAKVTIGALGTAEGNLALNKTSVVQSGVVQTITDNLQNGTSIGQSMLKLKATYVAKGWNFDNDWTIQETESYPYMRYQAAPPVIESNLVSQATSVSGKSINGGTVYLYYKDNAPVSQDCSGSHNWAFTTEPLQSGAEVRLYADAEGLTPSYFTTTTVAYPGSGTEDDPYLVYSAADLQGVSKQGYYKLMNDIDLTDWIAENSPSKGWVSIGRNGTEATYIDGDGHKITGLWTNTTDDYTGLFSNFSAGYIKNLTVEVASGKKVKGGDFTGILIGRIANGQIINCSVKGDVESTEKTLGGVVGAAYNTQISHVDYEGTVNSTSNSRCTGGLAGYTENGSVDNCSVITTINSTFSNVKWYDVGGLIGLTSSAVTKSSADVKVTVNGSLQSGTVGGLVGHLAAPGSINECYTTGSAVAHVESSEAYYNVGGLVGTSHCPISNCYSTADVTGTYFTGGLVGYTYSTITNCYAKGDVNGVMYGAGLVAELETAEAKVQNGVAANNQLTFTHQSSWASRVIGGYKNGAADPDNSNYALKTMQVTLNGVPTKKYDDLVEGIGKEESVLLTEAFYKSLGWNMTDTWGIDEGTDYPYLLWEVDINPVVEITFDKNTAVVAAGNTLTLVPSIQPLSATNKRLAWTTSKASVATVEDGIVTAVAIGEATITATATDGSGVSAQCKVTVVANHDEAIAQLRDDVDAALALYNNSTEGSNIGQYAAGSRAALLKVINEVRALISDTMDETAISNCSSKLAKAVADFKAQKVTGGADTDITLLDNVVYIEPVQSGTGRQLTLSVKMKNTKAFTGYKFDLYLPEGCTFATDEDGFPLAALSTERTTAAKTNYFDSSILGDGDFLRVLCYSSKGYAFTGEDGEIATVTIDIPADMEAGDYALVLKDIELAVGDESYDTDYVKSTLTVTTYKLGDANDDGKIGVADLTAIASHILGATPTHFVQAAADANEDGKIGVADLTCIAGWILNGTASNRRAPAATSMESMSVELGDFTIIPGGTAVVPVSISNGACLFSGYQFDVCLPEGFHVVSASLADDRLDAAAQTFDAALTSETTARVLCYSPKNTAFFGNAGVVTYLTIAADSEVPTGLYRADLNGAELSYYGASMTPSVQSASIRVALPTEIRNIESMMNANTVFDINGRRMNASNLAKGLYIMNGKKIVK